MKTFSLKKILTGIAIAGQVIVSSFVPLVANASIVFPQQVTIEYDSNQLYTMNGSFSDGTVIVEKTLRYLRFMKAIDNLCFALNQL